MNEQIHTTSTARPTSGGPLRAILWSLLVLGAVGNMVASAAAAGLTAHLMLGAVTAAAAAGLITMWMRTRV